jgi:D-alanyl-D-alanine carboxypeptidase
MMEGDLTSSTTITYADTWAEEDFGKLHAGEEYVLRELLFPLLLESSNDVAAHFERVTKGEVIKEMNNLANEAGLTNTDLVDASGLSAKNVSTASDLARFLSYLHQNHSHILDITTLRQYVGPYTGWVNNSPVLNKDYAGGKHGYTEAALRTGAVLFKEDISGTQRTIGYVVLGAASLSADITHLRDFVHTHVRFE